MAEKKLLTFLKEKAPSIASKLLKGAPFIGGLAEAVGDIINDDPDMTPTQKAEMQREAAQMALETARIDAETMRSHHLMEIEQLKSEDLFTKRARPSRMYAWLSVILFAFIIYPLVLLCMAIPVPEIKPLSLPEYFWYIMLGDAGLYSLLRTVEKQRPQGKEGILNSIGGLFKKT